MTHLIFRYSEVYDQNLSILAGNILSATEIKEGYNFTNAFQKYWNKFNDQIFSYFKENGLILPSYWLAYFIHFKQDLTPFSDPLTLIINENYPSITAVLLHEIGHVLLSYEDNLSFYKTTYSKINKKYLDESWETKIHIMVNILAYFSLSQIYTNEIVQDLLQKEKKYPGLERAWEIIDQSQLLGSSKSLKEVLEHI